MARSFVVNETKSSHVAFFIRPFLACRVIFLSWSQSAAYCWISLEKFETRFCEGRLQGSIFEGVGNFYGVRKIFRSKEDLANAIYLYSSVSPPPYPTTF